MEVSLPIEKHAPLIIIFFDYLIALQMGEARLGGSECNRSFENLYFDHRIFMHRLSRWRQSSMRAWQEVHY